MAGSTLVGIGLSGALAARHRVDIAANNIVNARSAGTPDTAFRPQRGLAQPLAGGGVRTVSRPVEPPFTTGFAPDHPDAAADGSVSFPNVSLVGEIVEMKTAARAYEASLRLIATGEELDRRLLDLTEPSRR